ncbi:MAG TPA: SPFH domain-containing protein, partial [Rhodocyclaceae bacterium]|nr:SPFH domain-containing protein [Rhodocyclaceae bacterium]
MALMDFIKKQFIDVIQWTEEGDGTLAWRHPMEDMEIQYGASLTVRDTQLAVFVDEGKIADVFAPGRYTLNTQTLPVLTYLKNWDKLFESPFKSDVYFYSTRIQTDRKWGTPNSITVRDAEFGIVRLRAFGIYSYRIADAKRFYQQLSGTTASYSTEDLEGQLRNTIVATISSLFGESGVAFIDMAGNQEKFSQALRSKLDTVFADLGLHLETLLVQNISLPEELQQ